MQLTPEFLPIGSIVEYNGMINDIVGIISPKPEKSKRFNNVWVVELSIGVICPLSDIKPITLTEKILIEWCNMKLERKQLSLNVGGELFEYAISSDNFCIYYSKLKGWTLDSRVTQNTVFIQYLHELQLCYLGTMLTPLPIKIK